MVAKERKDEKMTNKECLEYVNKYFKLHNLPKVEIQQTASKTLERAALELDWATNHCTDKYDVSLNHDFSIYWLSVVAIDSPVCRPRRYIDEEDRRVHLIGTGWGRCQQSAIFRILAQWHK